MTQDQVEYFMKGGAKFYMNGFKETNSVEIAMEFYKRGTIQKFNDNMVSSPGIFNNYNNIRVGDLNNHCTLNEEILYKIQDNKNLNGGDFRKLRAIYDYNLHFILIIEDTPVILNLVNYSNDQVLIECWGCPIRILLTREQYLTNSLFIVYGFHLRSSLRKLFRNYTTQLQFKKSLGEEHLISTITTADWTELI